MNKLNLLQKKLDELEFFINNNHISVNTLYNHYNKKLLTSDYDRKLCVRPMTENLNKIKVLSETLRVLLVEIKADIKVTH